jgi:hypothetical protein
MIQTCNWSIMKTEWTANKLTLSPKKHLSESESEYMELIQGSMTVWVWVRIHGTDSGTYGIDYTWERNEMEITWVWVQRINTSNWFRHGIDNKWKRNELEITWVWVQRINTSNWFRYGIDNKWIQNELGIKWIEFVVVTDTAVLTLYICVCVCVCVCMCTYIIHTCVCMCTYIIHTHIHTLYTHISRNTLTLLGSQPIHTYINTYIHTFIHYWRWPNGECTSKTSYAYFMCLYTYIHTYIHTYMHTYILRITSPQTTRWVHLQEP